MAEENISQEFSIKNMNETKKYLIEELNLNELISKKQKMISTTLNYIEHVLILASTFTKCVSISTFGSLIGIPMGIMSSAIGLKSSATTAWIKKYKSIIKKKRKNMIR